MSELEEVGFDPKRGLTVVNWFNKQIGDMHTASELNEYCEGYKEFDQVYFLMLHYKDGINKDKMSFEEGQQFYSKLAENESKAFQDRIQDMEKKQQESDAPDVKAAQCCWAVQTAYLEHVDFPLRLLDDVIVWLPLLLLWFVKSRSLLWVISGGARCESRHI